MKATYGDPYIEALVRKVAKGDDQAASKLYHLYAKAMYNTLYRMTNNEVEAQDLLQESFVKAFKHANEFKGDSTFGAWLKRIVVNTALEQIRKKQLGYVDIEDQKRDFYEPEETYDWQDIMADVSKVREAILRLPDGTRNVVSLYLLEGYTHDEIGEMLNISPSTSKTQYMRGKAMVKQTVLDSYGKRFV